MSEIQAYGASLCCLSRRLFTLGVALVLMFLCTLQVFRWVFKANFWDTFLGLPIPPEHVKGCTGTQCYDVFTCFGMKDATLHMREPLTSVAGAIFAPLGIIGAQYSRTYPLKLFALFLMGSALLHVGIVISDAAYVSTCGALPGNMLGQTVFAWPIGAAVPLSNAATTLLRNMAEYPLAEVAKITGSFNLQAWYYPFAGAIALFLVYAAYEASCLANVAEKGPLGLGVHYGLGQFDEVINYDAIRRRKMRDVSSQFIEDCKLPSAQEQEEEAALGYALPPAGYGATATQRTSYYAGSLDA